MDELLQGVAEKYGLVSMELSGTDSVVILDPSDRNRVLYQVWCELDESINKIVVGEFEYLGPSAKQNYDLDAEIVNWTQNVEPVTE